MRLTGNIIAEFVGASVDSLNNAMLLDIPGYIVSSTIGRGGTPLYGGLGGGNGTLIIGPTTIEDTVDDGNFQDTPEDNISLQALATDPLGVETYAFNVVNYTNDEDQEIRLVQLVQIDPETGEGIVVAHLADDLPVDDDGVSTVEAITAADFDPDSGLLYFVVAAGDGPEYTLYSLDVSDALGTLQQIPGTFGGSEVYGISFNSDGLLTAFIVDEETGQLAEVDITDTDNLSNQQDVEWVDQDGEAHNLEDIRGIEYMAGNDEQIYAITNAGADSGVYWIDVASGATTFLGTLPQGIESLSYDPTLINPFTGRVGALIGTDVDEDNLVFINWLPRFNNHIFAIHVLQSDADAQIAISYFDADGDSAAMAPFTGDVGSFQVLDANPDDGDPAYRTISAPANTGYVLIGARTNDLEPTEDVDEGNFAILQISQAESFGLLSARDQMGNMSAGVYVRENLLQFLPGVTSITDALIGSDFDDVRAMAISSSGVIAVVNARGLVNEFALMYRGGIVREWSIRDTGATGIAALAWGDPTGSGTESLYAVFTVGGQPRLGIIDTDRASAGFGTFTPLPGFVPGTLADVRAMAFDASGLLYMVHNVRQLVTYDVNSHAITPLGWLRTRENPQDSQVQIEIGSMSFDSRGVLLAHDKSFGRLVDIDIDNGYVGRRTKTSTDSLRISVGAIAYDPIKDQFLAIDNSTGAAPLSDEDNSIESASLYVLRGTRTNSATGQDLGKFLFAGTLTGWVNVSGSMDTFYAGWLLTGDAAGRGVAYSLDNVYDPLERAKNPTAFGTSLRHNFYVGGELRNLIVYSSIGTDDADALNESHYTSGFDMYVGNRLGQVLAPGHMIGSIDVIGRRGNGYLFDWQREIESRYLGFESGYLDNSIFNNDTFDTPQFLGTIYSSGLGKTNVVHLTGSLDAIEDYGDYRDFYGIALMAGQKVTVQLNNLLLLDPIYQEWPNSLRVGVYDPDGRLIISDYSDWDIEAVAGKALCFSADRPGVYRIVVGTITDGETPTPFPDEEIGVTPYELIVTGAGNVALGGLAVGGSYYDSRFSWNDNGLTRPENTENGIRVQNGDLGAVSVGNRFGSSAQGTITDPEYVNIADRNVWTNTTFRVDLGNLRSVRAGSIGYLDTSTNPPTVVAGATVAVPNGSVGLVSTTDVGGVLSWNIYVDIDSAPRQIAIGGHYQLIDAAGLFNGNVWADKSIGVVRAGSAATVRGLPGSFVVNADHRGRDGVIDLIDISGALGLLAFGGPAIETGPGGNVRYMRVGGPIFRDSYFGGGAPEATTFRPGETANLIDDSGAYVAISPSAGDALTVTTYGVRDSGGSAIVRVDGGSGINIRSSGDSGSVEIGELLTSGAVYANGPLRVDVLSIIGGAFTSIANNTAGGEFVAIQAGSIGELRADTVGIMPVGLSGVVINPLGVLLDTFPFAQQHYGVAVSGLLNLVKAKGAIGNISAGTINMIVADCDLKRAPGSFDGIVGPIEAGSIVDVTIGAGIATSGSGDLSHAGLYASGAIGTVRGRDATIYGNIVSTSGIGTITLYGASQIVGANNQVLTSLDQSREFPMPHAIPNMVDPVNDPTYEIGSITLYGSTPTPANPTPPGGGIIGTVIESSDIGRTRILNGFGLINSLYSVLGDGRIQGFEISGYGMRDVSIVAGASIGEVKMTGKGNHLAVTSFTSAVRESEKMKPGTVYIDPNTGREPSRMTDLHIYMQTTKHKPKLKDVTNSGVIAGSAIYASRDLGDVTAWQIRPSTRIEPLGVPTNFQVANSIRSITTAQDLIGAVITTGTLPLLSVGRNAEYNSITVSGIFSTLSIKGSLIGSHYLTDPYLIQAVGGNGQINSIFIGRNLDGSIRATYKIDQTPTILGDVIGDAAIYKGTTQIFP